LKIEGLLAREFAPAATLWFQSALSAILWFLVPNSPQWPVLNLVDLAIGRGHFMIPVGGQFMSKVTLFVT
jgi:hypothetical protein